MADRDLSDLLRRLYQIKKMPIMAKSSYRLWADDVSGVLRGEHKEISGESRLVGIFSFEGKNGMTETGLTDGNYTNLVDGKMIQVQDGKIDQGQCPVVIELLNGSLFML